jgi:AcrR family transcriptional regulator
MAEEGSGDKRRRRDAEATRYALLAAARRRFVRLGYDRTTLRDVASDAGVNLALIKRYFESKEGLFKAALATTPRFLGREGDVPRGRDGLAGALARQFATEAWPEFGEHPVLMLLHGSGDEQVDLLRREALAGFARQILESLELREGRTENPDPEVRAQLLIALGVGVAVLRSGVGLEPLGSADVASLQPALQDVVNALFPVPGNAGD